MTERDIMEWENTDEVMIIKDIPCKPSLCRVKNVTSTSKKRRKKALITASKTERETNQPITSLKVHLIVVFDTNILLESFGYKFCEYFSLISPDPISNIFQTEITFLIPWIVMQELNAIKENRNCKKSNKLVSDARCIINFLFNILSKHKWTKRITNSAFSIGISVKGQSSAESDYRNKISFVAECEDDAILQCCQAYVTKDHYPNFDQNQNRLKSVILLTNDKGLGMKALASHIPTHTIKEMSQETKVDFGKISKFDVTTFSRILDFFISKGYDNLTQEFKTMPDAGLIVLSSISEDDATTSEDKCTQPEPLITTLPEPLITNPTISSRNLTQNKRVKASPAAVKRKWERLSPDQDDVVVLENPEEALRKDTVPERNKDRVKGNEKEEIFYTQAANCFQSNFAHHPPPQAAIALDKNEGKAEMDVTPLVHTVYYQDINSDLSAFKHLQSESQIPEKASESTDETKHITDLIVFFEEQTIDALTEYLTYCYRYSYGVQWLRVIPQRKGPWKTVSAIMQSIASNWHACFRFFLNGHDRKKFDNLLSQLYDAKEHPSLINVRAYSIAFTHLLNSLIKGDMHPPLLQPVEQNSAEGDKLKVTSATSQVYEKILDKIRKHLKETFKSIRPCNVYNASI